MKATLIISFTCILFLTGCSTTTIRLNEPKPPRCTTLESFGVIANRNLSAEECHYQLIERFHANQPREVVRLANTIQRWESVHRSSSDQMAGYALLFLSHPQIRWAQQTPENWSNYIDSLLLANQAFQRSCRNDPSGRWNLLCRQPVELTERGFENPEALAECVFAMHCIKVGYYQKKGGDLAALLKGVETYQNLQKKYPEWFRQFPFLSQEMEETKTAIPIRRSRLIEAQSKYKQR